jgi:hypothetical protein
MRFMSRLHVAIVTLGLAAAFPMGVGGEARRTNAVGGPLTGPSVVGTPFSAEAKTTLTGVRADGARFQRSMPAVYYRDAAGRVRVEQTIEGGEGPRVIVQPDPDAVWVYWLDGKKGRARRMSRDAEAWIFGGGQHFVVPIAINKFLHVFRFRGVQDLLANTAEEPLGSRRIAGVETSGRRTTMTIPVGYLGNDRPLEIVDERWESPELHLLIESSYSDPRFGFVEYSVTDIRRSEPPPDLFVVPDEYNNPAADDEPWYTSLIPFDGFLSGKTPITWDAARARR